MKKAAAFFICFSVFAGASHSFAVTDPATPRPAKIDSARFTEQLVFAGTVKRLDQGTALFTEKQVYPLIGGDFGMIVGKNVKIIGTLVKEDNIDKLAVARVQFERQ